MCRGHTTLTRGNLAKYLARYAEPEATTEPPRGAGYSVAVVVPVCGEQDCFLARWEAAFASRQRMDHPVAGAPRPLVIVVVNADPHTAAPLVEQNQALLRALLGAQATPLLGPSPAWRVSRDAFDVVLVDRSTPPNALPAKCGVGLARKIGGDLVSAWFARGAVEQPWWLSTDADVLLPEDIVERLTALADRSGAAVLPFEHVPCGIEAVDEATFAVEVKLRYHVLGLRHAGSSYAWHALGSCLAVDVDTYASVRGFPKRMAGEDFYLLQKASKLRPVLELAGRPLRIQARRSARTPFGTGQEVEALQGGAQLMLRHPETYAWLGRVLTLANTLAQAPNEAVAEEWVKQVNIQRPAVVRGLHQIGVFEAWTAALTATRSQAARKHRLHEWFDGLRTIQFLKALEDDYPPVLWSEALRQAPFIPRDIASEDVGFEHWARQLRQHEASIRVGSGSV